MQIRSLLLLVTSALLANTTVNAQQSSAGVTQRVIGIVKRDTVAVVPNSIVGSTDSKSFNELPKPKYGPVPLAGTKSYFGEKNDFVNDYVRKYLESHNKTLNNVQNASTKPFYVIDNVLEEKQMPKELKYLAVIESALNHKAVSRAGAVGPWQLMESTAKMMGLKVSRHRDDRTDWYKSTNAATKYLEILYNDLQDWLLVIAAYNSGPTPVQKAIAKTGSRNFWDIKEYLPKETQGHVLAFIATASIFENLNKFINLGSVPLDFKFTKEEEQLPAAKPGSKVLTGQAAIANAPNVAPNAAATTTTNNAGTNTTPSTTAAVENKVVADKVTLSNEELLSSAIIRIKEPIHFDLISQELSIDKKLLVRWNPDYDQFALKANYPTPFYRLRIPKEKLESFMSKKEQMAKRSESYYKQITQ